MGHEVCMDIFPVTKNKKDIEKKLNQRAIEQGDYRTGLGQAITWHNYCLDSEEEAEEFIDRQDHGFYDQLAVKFLKVENFKPSQAFKNLEKRVEKAKLNYYNLRDKHYFENHKSKLITCSSCTSKISQRLYNTLLRTHATMKD